MELPHFERQNMRHAKGGIQQRMKLKAGACGSDSKKPVHNLRILAVHIHGIQNTKA